MHKLRRENTVNVQQHRKLRGLGGLRKERGIIMIHQGGGGGGGGGGVNCTKKVFLIKTSYIPVLIIIPF